MLLNQRLKHFRTSSGLTQQQVADVLGLDRSTYAYYESGKTTPDIKSVNKLLKLFNISYYELMEEPDPTQLAVSDPDSAQDDEEDKLHIYDLSKAEKRLVIYFRVLSPNQQKDLLQSISPEAFEVRKKRRKSSDDE
jgi:Predicted transcriptional regulators